MVVLVVNGIRFAAMKVNLIFLISVEIWWWVIVAESYRSLYHVYPLPPKKKKFRYVSLSSLPKNPIRLCYKWSYSEFLIQLATGRALCGFEVGCSSVSVLWPWPWSECLSCSNKYLFTKRVLFRKDKVLWAINCRMMKSKRQKEDPSSQTLNTNWIKPV